MSVLQTLSQLSEYDFDLPSEHIAQDPSPVRDGSRLMVLDRINGGVQHVLFSDIGSFLREGDLVVLNDTRVFPCRVPARKAGGGKAEIFLLEEQSLNTWRALVRGGSTTGSRLSIGEKISAEVVSIDSEGVRTLRFLGIKDVRSALAEHGQVPLPPYIKRAAIPADRERYQTVYAKQEGSVAAPTAGLHFTEALLDSLRAGGVDIATVTLHVGPGTFQPVRSANLAEHRMHPEQYEISEQSAVKINRARNEGRRVIAVGTTTVRTVETAAQRSGVVSAGRGTSELFILPGHAFSVIDGLVTNFHLPRSTLLMLVAAFAGRERLLDAYQVAIKEHYRFYSYGDAMLVL